MKALFLLSLGMFVLGMDAYVIAGILPAVGTTLQTNPSQTGQAVSIFTFFYALAAPVFATLLAGKPMRKVLVFALSVFSLANAASALAFDLPTILVARAIAGIGAGLYSPLAVAAAVSLVPANKRGQALGMTLGGMSMGAVLGVPLGLLVANYICWQGTLWLITILGALGLVGIILGFPKIPAAAPPSISERLRMLVDPRVSATVSITFLTSIASLGLYTYLAIILLTYHINGITPYLWAWGIGGVVGCFLIGPLIDHTKQPQYLMTAILILMAIAMFSLSPDLYTTPAGYLPFVLWGATGWASQAPQQHKLLSLQPKHAGSVIALNSSANYLGSAVGASLGGLAMLWGVTPTRLPLVAGFIILVALTGQLYLLMSDRHTNLPNSFPNDILK